MDASGEDAHHRPKGADADRKNAGQEQSRPGVTTDPLERAPLPGGRSRLQHAHAHGHQATGILSGNGNTGTLAKRPDIVSFHKSDRTYRPPVIGNKSAAAGEARGVLGRSGRRRRPPHQPRRLRRRHGVGRDPPVPYEHYAAPARDHPPRPRRDRPCRVVNPHAGPDVTGRNCGTSRRVPIAADRIGFPAVADRAPSDTGTLATTANPTSANHGDDRSNRGPRSTTRN